MNRALCSGACLLASLIAPASTLAAAGPGLPRKAYTKAQLFKPISSIKSRNGGHGNVTMYDGYLFVIYAEDSGLRGGGLSFYDMTDPANPKLVSETKDSNTVWMREAHGYGFTGNLMAMLAIEGIVIWDLSDIRAPKQVSYLKLPGIKEDPYDLGAWWLHYQAPYIYLGGSANGLYVIDAHDPKKPVLLKHLVMGDYGGFAIGPVFAIGNELIATNMNNKTGVARFDISDPRNPVLKDSYKDLVVGYNTMVNGGRLFGVTATNVVEYDIASKNSIPLLAQSGNPGGNGGYCMYQDGWLLAGASENFAKLDARNRTSLPIVGTGSSGISGRDEDFATQLGNLVYVGSDHHSGSGILVHDTLADVKGPEVNMVNPAPLATKQALTSRIGLTFTDLIDIPSANSATILVYPVGPNPVPVKGTYSHQFSIVNFSPDQPLLPNTTYEILVPKGGIKDQSLNPNAILFRSRFSTGATVDTTTDGLTTGLRPFGKSLAGRSAVSPGRDGVLLFPWDALSAGSPTPGLRDASGRIRRSR
jgi:hypothetical protein